MHFWWNAHLWKRKHWTLKTTERPYFKHNVATKKAFANTSQHIKYTSSDNQDRHRSSFTGFEVPNGMLGFSHQPAPTPLWICLSFHPTRCQQLGVLGEADPGWQRPGVWCRSTYWAKINFKSMMWGHLSATSRMKPLLNISMWAFRITTTVPFSRASTCGPLATRVMQPFASPTDIG